jgi:hypothetical protein
MNQPITDEDTENKDTSLNSPSDFLKCDSKSPRNAIERQFSLNFKQYEEDNFFDSCYSSKARLISGGG